MQIIVNFENGGTCIDQYHLDAMHWTMRNLLMARLTDIFAYLGMQAELWDCLWHRKLIKTKYPAG